MDSLLSHEININLTREMQKLHYCIKHTKFYALKIQNSHRHMQLFWTLLHEQSGFLAMLADLVARATLKKRRYI